MNQSERRRLLICELVQEDQRFRGLDVPADSAGQKQLLRSLMNVREPAPVADGLLQMQDEYLAEELRRREPVSLESIANGSEERTLLWQGDITRLAVDAIVNAANSQMLGCFVPCHGCIDNAIHTYAGMQLRLACADIMRAQGHPEPTGSAKITPGFNLPAKHVIHTVGPIVQNGNPGAREAELLASCYRSCLDLAAEHGLESIAFCCISTGVFGYPARDAAEVAIGTVRSWLDSHEDVPMRVVFNVFTDRDRDIYRDLLKVAL